MCMSLRFLDAGELDDVQAAVHRNPGVAAESIVHAAEKSDVDLNTPLGCHVHHEGTALSLSALQALSMGDAYSASSSMSSASSESAPPAFSSSSTIAPQESQIKRFDNTKIGLSCSESSSIAPTFERDQAALRGESVEKVGVNRPSLLSIQLEGRQRGFKGYFRLLASEKQHLILNRPQ
jgi:hypothetical protein